MKPDMLIAEGKELAEIESKIMKPLGFDLIVDVDKAMAVHFRKAIRLAYIAGMGRTAQIYRMRGLFHDDVSKIIDELEKAETK